MPRIVRVTDYGTAGWFISVCDKCGAEVGMSAQTHTREQAETARCFVCEPVPRGTVTYLPDPEDRTDSQRGDDMALRKIDDVYDRERRLCELAFWNAYAKGDLA